MKVGRQPKTGSLRSFQQDHTAIHFELDLHNLERLTEDIQLFDQAGMMPLVSTFVWVMNMEDVPGYKEWDYCCIFSYDNVPTPNFPGAHALGETRLSYEKTGTRLSKYIWSYDFHNNGRYELIADIFAWGATGLGYESRPLCYNTECLKRNHWVGENRGNYHKRFYCGGPSNCCHVPTCLMWGPVYAYNKTCANQNSVCEVIVKEDAKHMTRKNKKVSFKHA